MVPVSTAFGGILLGLAIAWLSEEQIVDAKENGMIKNGVNEATEEKVPETEPEPQTQKNKKRWYDKRILRLFRLLPKNMT